MSEHDIHCERPQQSCFCYERWLVAKIAELEAENARLNESESGDLYHERAMRKAAETKLAQAEEDYARWKADWNGLNEYLEANLRDSKPVKTYVEGRIDMRDEIIAKLKDFEAGKCAQIAASVPAHAGETE